MQTFDTATAVLARPGETYAWHVPEGWLVGRGAWGGLIVGALINAITDSEPDRRRWVRSVSAELVAPAMVGEHTIVTVRHRQGSGLSTWNATATNADGELVARLTAVLAASRRSAEDVDYAAWGMTKAPAAPPAADVAAADTKDFGPEFTQHLDVRPVSGMAYSGGAAEVLGYVRLAAPVPHTAASLIGLVDGWWPATIVSLNRFRPLATVNFSANLMVDPTSIEADEPLLHHGFASGADAGFTSEQRRLWTGDGRLVVDNLQSIALIK